MQNPIWQAARACAELGLAVVPLDRELNRPAIRYKWIEREGGMSADDLRRYFGDGRFNIGLLCGSASRGLMAIDLDSYAAYRDFERRHRKLSRELPYAVSPRGWHFYFRGPDGERGTRTYRTDGPNRPITHIKGDGNCITLPPSVRGTEEKPKKYLWVRPLPNCLGNIPEVSPSMLLPSRRPGVAEGISTWCYSADGGCGSDAWNRAHAAALRYQPYSEGTRGSSLFAFVRALRGIFGESVQVAELDVVFNAWFARIQDNSDVKEKGYLPNWRQFVAAWRTVKLDNRQAWAAMLESYNPPSKATSREKLLLLCEALSEWDADQNREFFLSAAKAGEVVGVNRQRAGVLIREMIGSGQLEVMERYDRVRMKATVYRLAKTST